MWWFDWNLCGDSSVWTEANGKKENQHLLQGFGRE